MGLKLVRFAIVAVFGLLVYAGTYVVTLPVRLAGQEWGALGAWAMIPPLLIFLWFLDRWLDTFRR